MSEELKNILLESSLIEKRKVQLITTDKINRMLASSMGKLKSIEIIAENAVRNLGDGLRMLVLTDFIKKEIKKSIGSLAGATERESKVFIKAVSELFSPIDDPRYVIIGITKVFKVEKRNYINSFSCPSVIGVNKESAEIFKKYLKSPAGDFELVFPRNENGRKTLNECKKLSFLNSIR